MKHNGRELRRYVGTVTLVRDVVDDNGAPVLDDNGRPTLERINITVQQLPVSWQEECERMLPPPQAPIVGQEKQPDGTMGPKYDYADPEYLKAQRSWEYKTWAKKIADATIDRLIEFETPGDLLASDPDAYYEAIFGELSEAFSRGELQRWLLTINSIDQVGGADVALIEQGLFPAVERLFQVPAVEEIAPEA